MPFRPVSDGNAIDQMAFKLRFGQPLESAFKSIEALRPIFRDDLPGMEAKQSVTFTVESAPRAGAGPVEYRNLISKTPAGFLFYSAQPDGQHKNALEVGTDQILVRCRKYDSFSSRWEFALKVLGPVASVLTESAVTSVGLEFSDIFTSDTEPTMEDITNLFKMGSKYLPPHCINPGMWHVNQGFFEDESLTNVNIRNELAQVDDKQLWRVVIQLLHRLDQEPISLKAMLENGELDRKMRQMHKFDKELLSALISDNSADTIGLLC